MLLHLVSKEKYVNIVSTLIFSCLFFAPAFLCFLCHRLQTQRARADTAEQQLREAKRHELELIRSAEASASAADAATAALLAATAAAAAAATAASSRESVSDSNTASASAQSVPSAPASPRGGAASAASASFADVSSAIAAAVAEARVATLAAADRRAQSEFLAMLCSEPGVHVTKYHDSSSGSGMLTAQCRIQQ
jgi:hypothetical protein